MPETTPLDSQLFSLKKPTHWLWRTNFTRDLVLQRLEETTITKDWLICPLGEANKAVTVASFASNPNVFQSGSLLNEPGTEKANCAERERGRERQAELSETFPQRHADSGEDTRASLRVALGALALAAVVVVLGVFICMRARQLGWTLGTIYCGLLVASGVFGAAWVLIWNPVVIARRMWPGPGVKAWDWVWTTLFMANFVTLVVVAVQDLETRDADPGPPGIAWLIGLAVFVSGWWLLTWSMVANPFFEKQVRIQTNHGHYVIDSGPYAYIRHPGYVGFVAVLLATPLLLASAWTFLPSLIASALFVIRTALEDRMLQVELPGYREYAGRVRYRLIPGLW